MNILLGEREARSVLLVRSVEETDRDGVILSQQRRAAATAAALESVPMTAGGRPDARSMADLLVKRALRLRDQLVEAAPALARLLAPPRLRGTLAALTLAAAAVLGIATNLLGPQRRISVLAFPLAGIVGWNLLVYVALAASAIGRAVGRLRRRGDPYPVRASLARWLEAAPVLLARRLGHGSPRAAVAQAAARFQQLWIAAAAPLVAARLRVILHLAALSVGLGAIVGLYASGIAFEYRATWESTWLDPPAVQRYLDVVLAPAARVLGTPVPDVAPLRGPEGEGSAAPWIHLWATTLVLVVVVPRAMLAVASGWLVARYRRRIALDLDDPYHRRTLTSARGTAVAVEIVYYSLEPDAERRAGLRTRLQELVGARAALRDGARLQYGDALSLDGHAPELVVVVFPLAQTPEMEVHGALLERVQERLGPAGGQLLVVLETATYRRRVGLDDRVRERRATWDRLLRELELTAVELDDDGGDPQDAIDRWVDRARQALWSGTRVRPAS